ncbi:MAG: hypothetical protein IT436_13940, partial [Phycisphaerales bacterium]|nr:hypothetical protein [Phycisphaerales bacterium]
LAQLSDAVVIVAARGTASGLVNAAIDRAHSMTDAVSLVFNRAHAHDLTTSASYSSFTSRPAGAGPDGPGSRSDRGRLVRILAPMTK